MPRDRTSRFKDMNGEVVHNLFGISSFSEYTVVDVTHVVKIRHDFPLDKACLLSCGVSTGVGAVWKVTDVEKGSTVAVFGLGAVGLAADANHVIPQTNIDNLCAQGACSQPSQVMQHQAKEADIHALSELTRALDKKV
ncbi:unnamed protein product [Lathyrus sativus]|nr:unnamed protein product [Lathyrus sativus]